MLVYFGISKYTFEPTSKKQPKRDNQHIMHRHATEWSKAMEGRLLQMLAAIRGDKLHEVASRQWKSAHCKLWQSEIRGNKLHKASTSTSPCRVRIREGQGLWHRERVRLDKYFDLSRWTQRVELRLRQDKITALTFFVWELIFLQFQMCMTNQTYLSATATESAVYTHINYTRWSAHAVTFCKQTIYPALFGKDCMLKQCCEMSKQTTQTVSVTEH